jgi:hypothetical protein
LDCGGSRPNCWFYVVSKNAIHQIFVDIDAQRNGIGTALLNQAKQMNPGGLLVVVPLVRLHLSPETFT